jgi:hypothetical protein
VCTRTCVPIGTRVWAVTHIQSVTHTPKKQAPSVLHIGRLEKWREKADSDIAKIIDVYLRELNAPLGYTGEQDENWFDRMREKDIKTLEEIKKRRLKS